MEKRQQVYAVMQVVQDKEFLSCVYESPVEATEKALCMLQGFYPGSFFYVKPVTYYLKKD